MASVVVSVDAELSNQRPPTERAKRRAIEGWQRLVDLFETYDVPATWAVVGRLCVTKETMETQSIDSWFTDAAIDEFERETSAIVSERQELNQRLSAPWLADAIAESPTEHDIGSHSYGHPRFTNVSRELAVADVEAATAALAEWNSNVNSFVYPFNAVAHRDVLAEAGFDCYRGTAGPDAGQESSAQRHPLHPLELVPERPKKVAGWAFDRVSETIRWTVGSEGPALVEPQRDDSGLVAVPSSLPSLYRMPVRVRNTIRKTGRYPIARVAKRGIDRAVAHDGTFHIWFHPADFHTERDFQSLARILEHADQRRSVGLRVETMADVAARVRSRREDYSS